MMQSDVRKKLTVNEFSIDRNIRPTAATFPTTEYNVTFADTPVEQEWSVPLTKFEKQGALHHEGLCFFKKARSGLRFAPTPGRVCPLGHGTVAVGVRMVEIPAQRLLKRGCESRVATWLLSYIIAVVSRLSTVRDDNANYHAPHSTISPIAPSGSPSRSPLLSLVPLVEPEERCSRLRMRNAGTCSGRTCSFRLHRHMPYYVLHIGLQFASSPSPPRFHRKRVAKKKQTTKVPDTTQLPGQGLDETLPFLRPSSGLLEFLIARCFLKVTTTCYESVATLITYKYGL